MKQRALRSLPADRKAQILNAAVQLALEIGYQSITREAVAQSVRVANSLISNYFISMSDLKRAVMIEAINKEILQIIAQGLAIRDPVAVREVNRDLKLKVANFLATF
jgi:AcrR family transcriptional regulator